MRFRFSRPSAPTRAIAIALLLALWLASTLGVVHASLHVPGQEHGQRQLQPGTVVQPHAPHRHGWLGALFGDRTDAQCRLYDQLSHGAAALAAPAMLPPVLPPVGVVAAFGCHAVARWAAMFEARGPPRPR